MPLLSIESYQDARFGIWEMSDSPSDYHEWYAEASLLYKSEARRKEYVFVRALLERMTGAKQVILHDKSGKPYLDGNMQISLSHTKGYRAVIVSDSRAVGIDIEYMSDRVDKIARKFIRNDEPMATTIQKLLLWSAKEAVYKLFSSYRLDYFEMRVFPFEVSWQGIMRIENLRNHSIVDVAYRVCQNYVLTYTIGDNS